MKNILETVGNTPIVKLKKIIPSGCGEVYVKLEANNPTGSKKDRMALSMIEGAEKRGDLKEGMSVVEYSGGSTGAGLAFVCAIKGYRFRLISCHKAFTELCAASTDDPSPAPAVQPKVEA